MLRWGPTKSIDSVPSLKKGGKKILKAFDKANEKKVGEIIGPVLKPEAIPNFGK